MASDPSGSSLQEQHPYANGPLGRPGTLLYRVSDSHSRRHGHVPTTPSPAEVAGFKDFVPASEATSPERMGGRGGRGGCGRGRGRGGRTSPDVAAAKEALRAAQEADKRARAVEAAARKEKAAAKAAAKAEKATAKASGKAKAKAKAQGFAQAQLGNLPGWSCAVIRPRPGSAQGSEEVGYRQDGDDSPE